MKRETQGKTIETVQRTRKVHMVLFGIMFPLIVITGISTIIFVLNESHNFENGVYANINEITNMDSVVPFSLLFSGILFITTMILFFKIITDLRVGLFSAFVIPTFILFILIIWVSASQSFKLEDEITAHNDAVTIEKLKTEYDSAKELNLDDEVLEAVPNSSKVDSASPYLAEKDGEEYILYVSVDTKKNTTKVLTEIPLDKIAPVKVIK